MSCGKITLPVDWSKPSGPTFELALAKRPADDQAASKGPLFINPGGPGGSGVSQAFNAANIFSPDILKNFDIIGVDPRGVARSHPVVCSSEAFAQPGETVLPRSRAEFDALVRFNKQLAADCRQQTGPLYDHVDSISVARDLDAVRAALGADKLNWYGASYGSLMGQMYAELFPHRIRSMVNDGNMDHSLGNWSFLLSEGAFAEDSFQQFVDWCGKSPNCELTGQDVPKVYAELLAKADAGTLVDPSDGTTVGTWDLLDVTQFFFSRPRWVQLGQLLNSLHTGTASPALKTARAELAALPGTRQSAVRAAVAVELVEDVRPQFCQDWSVAVRTYAELDAMYKASLKVAPRMRASVLALQSMTQCIGWPGKVNNPQHRLEVKNAPTILMMNGIHDPATGYAWALNVKRQLGKGAVLVTYDGAGHVIYPRTACTRAAADNYFLNLTLPSPDTRCAANDPALTAASTTTPEATARW